MQPKRKPEYAARALIALAGAYAALMAVGSDAAKSLLTPGLYRVEVRIGLPNVQDTAPPMVLTRCVATDDLESGQAFFVLSDNPLKNCELVDYQPTGDTATYRILCQGPNMGSAVAVFEFPEQADAQSRRIARHADDPALAPQLERGKQQRG